MANLNPEIEDRLIKLDRHCEALGKEDPDMESYLKNFRTAISHLIRKAETYTPEEFKRKCAFVRDAVVDLHFGRGAEKKQKRGG